tara:strand:+ start:388 stop:495 length:108 start_codon:yes stop_codon:yes gene_type:complete
MPLWQAKRTLCLFFQALLSGSASSKALSAKSGSSG